MTPGFDSWQGRSGRIYHSIWTSLHLLNYHSYRIRQLVLQAQVFSLIDKFLVCRLLFFSCESFDYIKSYPCVCVCVCVLVTQLCPTLCDPTDCCPPDFCPWNSPRKNTGVDCHSLLQIFPTQGLNSDLLHYRQILYCLSYREVKEGSPILKA